MPDRTPTDKTAQTQARSPKEVMAEDLGDILQSVMNARSKILQLSEEDYCDQDAKAREQYGVDISFVLREHALSTYSELLVFRVPRSRAGQFPALPPGDIVVNTDLANANRKALLSQRKVDELAQALAKKDEENRQLRAQQVNNPLTKTMTSDDATLLSIAQFVSTKIGESSDEWKTGDFIQLLRNHFTIFDHLQEQQRQRNAEGATKIEIDAGEFEDRVEKKEVLEHQVFELKEKLQSYQRLRDGLCEAIEHQSNAMIAIVNTPG